MMLELILNLNSKDQLIKQDKVLMVINAFPPEPETMVSQKSTAECLMTVEYVTNSMFQPSSKKFDSPPLKQE